MHTLEFFAPNPPFIFEKLNVFVVFTAKRQAWGFLPSSPFAAVYMNVWLTHNATTPQTSANFGFRVLNEDTDALLAFSASRSRSDNRHWHELIWLPSSRERSAPVSRDLLHQFFGPDALRLTCAEKLPDHAQRRLSTGTNWPAVRTPPGGPSVGLSFLFNHDGQTRQLLPCHITPSPTATERMLLQCTPFRYAYTEGANPNQKIDPATICSVWLTFLINTQNTAHDEIAAIDLKLDGIDSSRVTLAACIASRYSVVHENPAGGTIAPARLPSPDILLRSYEPVYVRLISAKTPSSLNYSLRLSDNFFRTEAGLATVFLTTLLAAPLSYLVNSIRFHWVLIVIALVIVLSLLLGLVHVNSRRFAAYLSSFVNPHRNDDVI